MNTELTEGPLGQDLLLLCSFKLDKSNGMRGCGRSKPALYPLYYLCSTSVYPDYLTRTASRDPPNVGFG